MRRLAVSQCRAGGLEDCGLPCDPGRKVLAQRASHHVQDVDAPQSRVVAPKTMLCWVNGRLLGQRAANQFNRKAHGSAKRHGAIQSITQTFGYRSSIL